MGDAPKKELLPAGHLRRELDQKPIVVAGWDHLSHPARVLEEDGHGWRAGHQSEKGFGRSKLAPGGLKAVEKPRAVITPLASADKLLECPEDVSIDLGHGPGKYPAARPLGGFNSQIDRQQLDLQALELRSVLEHMHRFRIRVGLEASRISRPRRWMSARVASDCSLPLATADFTKALSVEPLREVLPPWSTLFKPCAAGRSRTSSGPPALQSL